MNYGYWYSGDVVDRRISFKVSFRAEYQTNGDDVQRRIGTVVALFRNDTGIELPEGYASGWRPPQINEATSNAAIGSNHLRALAGDKRDSIDGSFGWWCLANLSQLESVGLYMEHPIATVVRAWRTGLAQKRDPTPWTHLQSVAPISRGRVYWPDQKSLPEWADFVHLGGQPGITFEAWKALQPTQ